MSDWKKSAAERRDARHGGPARHTRARSSKDRKRWCGGHEGREHKPRARKYDEVKGLATFPTGRVLAHPDWWILVCDACGKELDRYWPLRLALVSGGYTAPEHAPAWVPSERSSR